MSDNAQRGYRLASYWVDSADAEALNTCLDQWMAIWSKRGETLPNGAYFVFEVCPGRDEIEVRCRIVLAEPEQRADRECWQDVQRPIAAIGRPELTDDALIDDLAGEGGIRTVSKLLEREDPA